MSESLALVAPGHPMLDYLPVGLFSSVMGLTGLSVAWRLAAMRYGTPEWIALGIAGLAVLGFLLVLAGYCVKLVTVPAAVRAEFRHPVADNLFGTGQGWANSANHPPHIDTAAPPISERRERSLMGLVVVVVLLLVIMPTLLYLIGRGITRYTRKAPASVGFPAPRDAPTDKPSGEQSARIKA